MIHTSIIVSHNSRIQCFLDNIFSTNKRRVNTKTRFKNGCVVKLILSSKLIELSLLYNGQISTADEKSDKIYYVNKVNDYDKKSRLFEHDIMNNPIGHGSGRYKPCLTNLKISEVDLATNTFIFYIVRHGKSTHNLGNTFHLTKDTSLVPGDDNEDNIKNAGSYIFKDICGIPQFESNSNTTVDSNILDKIATKINIFVSDLKRTVETANLLVTGISREKKQKLLIFDTRQSHTSDTGATGATGEIGYTGATGATSDTPATPDKFIVLPCSHEVARSGNGGDCDASTSFFSKGAYENYTKCTTKTIKDKTNKCNIGLDWTFYLDFYNQQMRGDDNFMFKKTRKKCRETNMVALSIDYLTGKRGGSSRIFTVFNKRVQHKKRKNTKKNVQY